MLKLKTYPVSTNFSNNSWLNTSQYQTLYQYSIENPEEFWSKQAEKFIDWYSRWHTVQQGSFENPEQLSWYAGATLNASYNCLDRHLEKRGHQTAIIWEGDDPKDIRHISYRELHELVCQLANALNHLGIKKGDRVCIYLPMIPEAAIAMLACCRIGAIHSVVFAGFSAEALKTRIQDAKPTLLITADESLRGGKIIPLKAYADQALSECPMVKKALVVKRTGGEVSWNTNRDLWYQDVMDGSIFDYPPEIMDATDPLFILYTSGSTGKPKGILHNTAGYLVYAAMTYHYIFDYHPPEIYWCTADVGWITGHTYVI